MGLETLLLGFFLLFILSPHSSAAVTWLAPVQLTNNTGVTDSNPVISRDGSRIAYQAFGSSFGDSEILTMNSDGTGSRQLTNNLASDFSPSITGDGSTVVFFSNVDGDFEVFKANSDGTGLSQLTFNAGFVDSFPAISSDGSMIAFQSNRTGNLEVFSMLPDGSTVRQLTFNGARDEDPSIAADGSLIAFVSNVTGKSEVFIVNSDGSQPPLQLTSNGCREKSPAISGNGMFVAFQSDCDGDWEIMLVRSDGSDLRQLTLNSAADQFPSVNYDGTWIAYVSDLEGDNEILVVNSDGTHIDQLTSNTAPDGNPSIDGIGRRVVYQSDVDMVDTELFLVERPLIHDVAVTDVSIQAQAGDTHAYIGVPVLVRVVIANLGEQAETVTLSVFHNSSLIASIPGIGLVPGVSVLEAFEWDTSGLLCGDYVLSAQVSSVPDETGLQNNTRNGPVVVVRITGDVDGDRDVDILDAAILAFSFGRMPGQMGWVANADLDDDGDVDIVDAARMAVQYGQTC